MNAAGETPGSRALEIRDRLKDRLAEIDAGRLEGKKPALKPATGSRRASPQDVASTSAATEAGQILAEIVSRGLERAADLDISGYGGTESDSGRLFNHLFEGRVLFVEGVPRVYWAARGLWLEDPEGAYCRRLALVVGALRETQPPLAGMSPQAAAHFIQRGLSATGAANLVRIAATDPALMERRDRFDADPDLILDAAGTAINLGTKETRQATPEDKFSKSLGVVYNPSAKCPGFDKFIRESMQGRQDDVRFLQRWTGYSLTGHTREQKIVFRVGPGRNGKSTFDALVVEIAGTYALTAEAELLTPTRTRNPEYQLAQLEGRRLVFIRESTQGAALDESTLKGLVSAGDRVIGRHPYGRPFEFIPIAKFTLETNHLPRIRSQGLAVWRRILRESWLNIVPDSQVDKGLLDKLRQELPGILNFFLEGARLWYAEGLAETESMRAALARYRSETDTLGDFLAGLHQGPNLRAGSAELYKRYRIWAEDSGLRPWSDSRFKEELESRGFTYRRSTSSRFYEGIGLEAGLL
jgi:putative DNA primase/helicase